MDKYQREQRSSSGRKPLTLHEKWEIDVELIRKSAPEYYDNVEELQKSIKANGERLQRIIEKNRENKQ